MKHLGIVETPQGLEVDGRQVDMDKEYFIAINSLFNEIPADGVEMFNKSPCVRLHDALIRDVTCAVMTCFFSCFFVLFSRLPLGR